MVVFGVPSCRGRLPDGRFAYDMKRALPDGRRNEQPQEAGGATADF